MHALLAQMPAIAQPTPIVTPTESSGPALSERSILSDRIDQIVASAKTKTGGTLGVVVWDLGTNVLVQRNAEQAFPMAGVLKLAIALAAYDGIDRGQRAYSTREQIDRMLIDGDAATTDALYRTVGGADAINASLRRAGIDAIVVRTNEAGNAANAKTGKTFAQGGDNAASPASIALLLSELDKGHVLSAASRAAFLEALARVNAFPAALRAGLPPKTRLRHEIGMTATFEGVVDGTNDVGIATINGRDVVIVTMLQGARGSVTDRDAALASVARAAYDATRLFPL